MFWLFSIFRQYLLSEMWAGSYICVLQEPCNIVWIWAKRFDIVLYIFKRIYLTADSGGAQKWSHHKLFCKDFTPIEANIKRIKDMKLSKSGRIYADNNEVLGKTNFQKGLSQTTNL